MTCDAPLTFVMVMVCSAVVEPTGTYPKSRDVGVIKKSLVVFAVGASLTVLGVGAADAIVVTLPVTPAARSTDRRIRRPGDRRENIIPPCCSSCGSVQTDLVSPG
jgi:hypothetical protein